MTERAGGSPKAHDARMQPTPRAPAHARTDQRFAAGLVGAGGALAVVAGFLNWAELAPAEGAGTTFRGFDLSAGTGSLAFGVGLAVVAIFLLARGGRIGGRGASIAAIVFAAVLVLAAGYSSLAPAEALIEFQDNRVAGEFGFSLEVGRIVDQALERGPVEVSSLLGSWVAAIGGLVGLAGGVVGLVRARRIRAATPAAEETPSIPPPPYVPRTGGEPGGWEG